MINFRHKFRHKFKTYETLEGEFGKVKITTKILQSKYLPHKTTFCISKLSINKHIERFTKDGESIADISFSESLDNSEEYFYLMPRLKCTKKYGHDLYHPYIDFKKYENKNKNNEWNIRDYPSDTVLYRFDGGVYSDFITVDNYAKIKAKVLEWTNPNIPFDINAIIEMFKENENLKVNALAVRLQKTVIEHENHAKKRQ